MRWLSPTPRRALSPTSWRWPSLPVAGGHRSDPRADVYRPFRTAFDNAGDEHPGLSLHHLAYFYGTFLIPHWNGAILQTVSFSATGDGQGIMLSLWMTFPVLVMSFNHYPIISPMVVRQKQRYGLALAEGKCAQIQRYGILLMTVVVLFLFSAAC